MLDVRARNEGSLFQRSRDGRWVAMVTMPDGSRRSAVARNRSEAAKRLVDLTRERDAEQVDARKVRLGDYLARWVSRLDLAPATIRQHEMIVRVHLIPALGKRRLAELTRDHVDDYLARTDLDPQTLRHHRSTLRLALNQAIGDGYITKNAAALSKPPRMHKAERRYLSAAEVRRLIEEGRDARLWPLHVLIVSTGLRVSEALGLAWSDVGPDSLNVRRKLVRVKGEWLLDEPKSRRSRRTITLIPQAKEALAVQRERQAKERGDHPESIDGLVFTDKAGQPIHSTNVLPSWYALLSDLGLPKVTTHDLRHTTATLMLASGVPLPVIAEILGHSTVRVTADLYAHIVPELRQDAADRLSEALS